MKKFRKIMAVLVAAMMIVAMAVPAFAAETGEGRMQDTKGTITISNPNAKETYSAYKILDLVSFTDNDVATDKHQVEAYAYAVKTDSAWVAFIKNTAKDANNNTYYTGNYFECDNTKPIDIKLTDGSTAQYYIVTPHADFKNDFKDTAADLLDETDNKEWTTASKAQALAQAAVRFAKDHLATNPAVAVAASGSGANIENNVLPLTIGGGTVSNNNDKLELGYYVIDSTMGTLCSLDTTNTAASIIEKNSVPTIDKEVKEDSRANAGTQQSDLVTGYVPQPVQNADPESQNDADIGQTIYYRTLINVKKGAENYVLLDSMEEGLNFDGVGSIKVFFLKPSATLDTKNEAWVELSKDDAEGANIVTLTLDGKTQQTTTTYKPSNTNGDVYYSVATNGVVYDDNGDDPDTMADFKITFGQKFLTFLSDQMNTTTDTTGANNYSDSYRLLVTYTATLNKNAVVDKLDANHNEVKLQYGDSSNTKETAPVSTSTATWSTKIRKFTKEKNNATSSTAERTLAGAHFQVFNAAKPNGTDNRTAFNFVYESEGVYRYDERVQSGLTFADQGSDIDNPPTATYSNSADYNGTPTDETVVNTLVVPESGIVTIKGLDGDSYYLKETLAPLGYNQLTGEIPFHIVSYDETFEAANSTKRIMANTSQVTTAGNVVVSDQGAVIAAGTAENGIKYGGNAETANTLEPVGQNASAKTAPKQIGVENFTSTELPSTGGMGTTVLYIVGGMLVILAGAYLFFSRKRTA